MKREKILNCIIITLVVLIIIIFLARTMQVYSYPGQVFVQIGFFYDKICANGSYEMIVCPYTMPPYEVLMVLLGILLATLSWIDFKKSR